MTDWVLLGGAAWAVLVVGYVAWELPLARFVALLALAMSLYLTGIFLGRSAAFTAVERTLQEIRQTHQQPAGNKPALVL